MKKLLLCFLISFQFSCLAQNATETETKEIFGERFISCKDIGLSNDISIPFTREELIVNRFSWLIPINNDVGTLNYELIQVNSGNEYLGTVLSLEKTTKILKTMNKAHRNFPDNQLFKFFKTNDKTDSLFDLDFRKTIVCVGNKSEYSLIDLPSATNTVAIGEKSVYYIMDDGSAINVCPQKKDDEWVTKYKIISLTK